MPKIKTHKATSKRFKLTGGVKKKMTQRKAGQGHFNSRESGNTKRNKRSDIETHDSLVKTIKRLTPYN
ncbi:50S ribosomal protein L35 [Candidatus Parcubacteria bacterium]|nr:50S ribosomal protein L35 [Candidatus Parcubacteria bacterium]